jgi:hypothetical protein
VRREKGRRDKCLYYNFTLKIIQTTTTVSHNIATLPTCPACTPTHHSFVFVVRTCGHTNQQDSLESDVQYILDILSEKKFFYIKKIILDWLV